MGQSSQEIMRMLDLVSVGFSTAEGAVEVDCADCEGVMFVGVPGTTAVRLWSMALKYAVSSTSSFINCASTHTHASTAANNNVLVTIVHKPAGRYLGATLTSSAATPSRLLAWKFGMRKSIGDYSVTGGANTVPIATGGVKRVVSPTSST